MLNMKVKRVKSAKSYCYIVVIAEVLPTNVVDNNRKIDLKAKVIILPAGSAREVVRTIAPGTKVTVLVLAQNAAGISSFSNPASIFIAKPTGSCAMQ